MTPFDHLLALVLVIVFPLYALWSAARLRRQLAQGEPLEKLRLFVRSMIIQWTVTMALLLMWNYEGHAWGELGLMWPRGAEAWGTAALCGSVVIFYLWQIRTVIADAAVREQVRAQAAALSTVKALMPVNPREMAVFAAVSVTAGVCEEVLFRGYLLWYLSAWMPWAAAVTVTIVIFGVGHAYQGARGIALTGIAGAVFMAAYVFTGSLVAPIVLHAVVDLANGYAAYRAMSTT